MGPGRPKNQSAQNGFKMDVCVGLVDTNPTQLERAQTERRMLKISRSVHFSKHAKKMMTVQSVQCHVAADCTGRTTIQLTWQGALAC
jgi:hypothetical protein